MRGNACRLEALIKDFSLRYDAKCCMTGAVRCERENEDQSYMGTTLVCLQEAAAAENNKTENTGAEIYTTGFIVATRGSGSTCQIG